MCTSRLIHSAAASFDDGASARLATSPNRTRSQPDLFLKLGNLLQEPVTRIWDRYPYKRNHFAKYLGASIYAAARSSP